MRNRLKTLGRLCLHAYVCLLIPPRRFPRYQRCDLFFGQAEMQEENGSKQGAQLLIQKEQRWPGYGSSASPRGKLTSGVRVEVSRRHNHRNEGRRLNTHLTQYEFR